MHYLIVSAEPTIDDLNNIFKEIEGYSFDIVVGIGGGSVLDISKLFHLVQSFLLILKMIFLIKSYLKEFAPLYVFQLQQERALITAFATIWNKKEKKYSFQGEDSRLIMFILGLNF